MNPGGTVPVLVHEGHPIYESHDEMPFSRIPTHEAGAPDHVTGYVLKRASSETEAVVERNIDDAVAALPALLGDGLNAAMKKLHTKD